MRRGISWKERVYVGIAKIWMYKHNSGEEFSAVDIGDMLMEDLQNGKFYQKLLDAHRTTLRFKFHYFWYCIYKKILQQKSLKGVEQ